jgi:hypothetical protein
VAAFRAVIGRRLGPFEIVARLGAGFGLSSLGTESPPSGAGEAADAAEQDSGQHHERR